MKLGFGILPDDVEAGTPSEATVTIDDDDDPAVTVSFEQAAYSVNEGSNVTVAVTLSADPERTVQVTLTKADQGGATSADYSNVPASVTFDAGDTRKTFTFTAEQDTENDDGESVKLGFGPPLPDGVTAGPTSEATVSITDDDVPSVTVSFQEASYTVDEGDSATVKVVLSADPERTVTIPLAPSHQGGATASDYNIPANIVFDSGDTEKTFSFSATQDTDDDDGESVKLGFGNTLPAGVSAGTTPEATVSITDDDDPQVTVSFGQAAYTVAESDDASTTNVTENEAEVTVILSADPERTVEVPITVTDMDGASSADYSGIPDKVVFNSGDTRKSFAFSAAHDTLDDDGERVRLNFGTLPPRVNSAAPSQAVVSITDDDDPQVSVSFGQASYTVSESDDAGTTNVTENEVAVTVTLSADPKRTVAIPLTTTNQGGAGNSDYASVPASVVFNSGDTEKSFTFQATPDDIDDDGESVKLGFGTPLPDGVSTGSPAESTVSITDDDTAGVSISDSSLEMEEGDSDTYTVVLDTQPAGNVTVTISGIAGTDVTLNKTTLTFTTGNWDTAQEVRVTAEQDDDAVDEAAVNITHAVSSSADSVYDGLAAPAVAVSVTDDDTAGVTVSQTSLEMEEGDSDTYTVVLDTQPVGNVTVTTGGISGTDLTLDRTTLTFTTGNWDTAQTVRVTAGQDDDAVDEDVVNITHAVSSAADTGYDGVSAGSVAVSVTDDDTVGVTLSETSLEIEEGNSDTYTVVLDTEPAGDVTVTLGGVSGTDLTLDKTTLTFTTGNWDTEQTVRVTAEQDADAVDEDVVNITHTAGSTADTQYDGLSVSSVAVTVTDDETPSSELTLTMTPPAHGDTDVDGKVNLGDTLRYRAVATNSGNVPLENVNVKDALINTSGTDCASLPIGATCTSTVTYTIVQADVDRGSVSNTATAAADGVSAKTVARQTAVDQVEDLTLEKTTTADAFAGTAVSIPYSYRVTNTGTVTLSGTLEIDDDKIAAANITCPAVPQGGLTPGAFLTCTGSYTTTQADVDAGKVTNEATASLGGVTSGSDSVTVNWQAPQGSQPQLSVGSGEDDEDAGSFTFTVTLNPSSLQNVTVDYATGGGTATSGSDYTPASGSLTFSPGDTTKNVTVTIADDDLDESDETFNLTLSDPVNASIPIPAGVFTIRDDDTAGVTVSDTSLDIDEGDSDTYTVVLDSQPTHDVTITVNDPSNTDVTADPADLTFTPANWDTAQTVTVSAAQDSGHDDEDGTVTHTASSSDAKYDGISVAGVLVNVADDEDTPVTVSFGAASYTVAEGNTVAVKVKLSADPERTVEVPITATTMDGAADADFSGVPEKVVFNSGDTEKTFNFEAVQDTDNDDGERVRLTFGTLPPGVSSASPSQAVVSITDDDVPNVTVSFEQPSYTVEEGDSVSVKVILSAQPERAVDIQVSAAYLDGVGSTDFSGAPATLNFGASDTQKTLTFEATDDSVDDDGEKVRLSFVSLPAGVARGSTDETTVSITDNDHPHVTVSFAAANYTVAESDDSTTPGTTENQVSVAIRLSADPERSVTIPITATGQDGATAADFSVPANVVFNSGDTEKEITFQATPDGVDDDGESVKLGFGSTLPARITEGTPAETTVSITDDDVPSVTASFEQPSYTVAEGSSEEVKVVLSADPERTVTIPLLRVNQGGATTPDYTGVPPNVVFDSGDTEKTFTFTAASDSDNDDGESVRVSFGTLPDRVSAGTNSGTTISITDDDVPSVTVSFQEASYTVDEGNTALVKVVLSADPERTVTIPLTKTNQGGATASDYSVPGSIVFNSGDTEKTLSFQATQDSVDDDGESVKLGFGSSLPTGVTKGSMDETTVSITDDDVPSVNVSFGSASYTVGEGNSVSVKVVLSADPERTVTIPLTSTNQGGASAADYTVPASVVFNTGDTEKTFSFQATQDTVDDDGESVRLGFGSSLPSRVAAGTPPETVVSITDDDVPSVTVRFEQTAYTVAEGSSEAVKVILSADPERTVEVPISTTDMDGASSSDYSVVPQTVVFNSGDTEKTLSFSATDDTEDDDGERVRLTFGALPPRVSSASPSQAVVSITDDDAPLVTVSFEQTSYAVAEGNSVSVKVTLSTDPERTVTIPLTKSNQGGATASDYSAPSSVVFNSGDTEKAFDFEATQDTANDDGESVKLGFGTSLPTGVTAGSPAETTVSITDDDHPQVTVSFAAANYTVAESDDPGTPSATENEVTVTIRLSADPERTVTIPVTATGQGGASAADYTVPNEVVFDAGDTQQEITFRASPDDVDDDGESVKLGFGSSLPAGVTAGSPAESTVSITDDDAPSVNVSFEQSSYTVAEGNSVMVKAVLSADPERTVTIPISAANQGGATTADYSVPGSVVFNSGDTEKTFNFSATQDAVDDDGESVKLGFGGTLPDGVSQGSPDEAVISITDDDVPGVTASFEQAAYSVDEGDTVEVKVILSAQPERVVEIRVTATYLGGAGSTDFTGAPTTLSFGANETQKTLTFRATDDSLDDDGESVRLNLADLPAGVTSASPSQTEVSINDDDDPAVTVSFEQAAYSVAESDDPGTTSVAENQASIKVILSADPERTVTIPLTKTNEGGATAGDYSGVPANVVFDSGEREQSFIFTAEPDTVDDDGESVNLGFGGTLPAGVSQGSPDEAVVSITDDDVPSVTVSFEQPSYTVGEGASVSVKVTLSADPERTVTIPLLKVNQGGASSADYSGVPPNLVFNSGDTEKTFNFEATNDTSNDDGESVRVSFGNLPDQVSAGTHSGTTVSITDDDAPSVTVSYEQDSYTVAEGGSVTVKVVLSADPERTVTVPITSTGQDGATASDYSVPASVVFNSGDTEKTFAFAATDDSVDDDGESVKLGFGNSLPASVSAGTTTETTVSITDDDAPSVSVSFEQGSYTVAEGNSVSVKVLLSADPERTVTIPLTKTHQDGATASDYSVPNSVVFNSGDTEKTFSFQAAQDTVDDDGESVKLGFGNLPTGVSAGSTDETAVSITDDDVPSVTVRFEQSAYTVAEGSSETVKVVLSADPERTVEVPISATDMDGASSSDYSIVPQTVVFNSGDTEKTLSFSATDDTEDDDGERVRLNFGNLPPRVSSASPSQAVVSITDDDVLGVTVSFGQASYTALEGGSVPVKVVLSADPERTVTIPVTASGQGGATSSDYSVPGSIVFNSGDTEKTISFQAVQDTVDDDGESVKLGFGNSLPAGVTVGSTDETIVSITDDDVPSVTVSFEQPSYTVGEGSSVTVKVKLSADPERTVEVPVTATNQGGATAADYSAPASVAFNSGDTEKTLTFTATQDTIDDDGESVKLGFGNLPAGVSKGAPGESTVSITDDDVPQVTVSFEQATYEVMEIDDTSTTEVEENKVSVKVTLSADPERTVTIPITKTNLDGASDSDYSGVPSNLTFNSGDTEKTIVFAAIHDEEDDDDESVKLAFDTLPAGVSAGSISETVVSIIDVDGGRVGTNKEIVGEGEPDIAVSFEEASYTAREGSTVTVKVILSAAPQADFSLPLTATAGAGLTASDHSGAPATLDFETGDTEKSFVITAVQDDEDESDEKLTLGFGTLLEGLTEGTNTQAEVTIADSVHVSFGTSSYEAYEGGAGALVAVELDSAAATQIVVPITATGMNGATSADWTGVPPSVTFAPGDARKTFTLMAYDDTVEDDGETVELGFGNLPAGVARGTPSVATVELMNMEVPTCETAVWCATAEFADSASKDWKRPGLGLGYHTTQEPYPRHSSLSDARFTFRGREYLVWSLFISPEPTPTSAPAPPAASRSIRRFRHT